MSWSFRSIHVGYPQEGRIYRDRRFSQSADVHRSVVRWWQAECRLSSAWRQSAKELPIHIVHCIELFLRCKMSTYHQTKDLSNFESFLVSARSQKHPHRPARQEISTLGCSAPQRTYYRDFRKQVGAIWVISCRLRSFQMRSTLRF